MVIFGFPLTANGPLFKPTIIFYANEMCRKLASCVSFSAARARPLEAM